MISLFFGSILAIFNTYVTQNFAEAYRFMNWWRGFGNLLLTNLITYQHLNIQSTELIQIFVNIIALNQLYTDILLRVSPSLLTTLLNIPPNPAILDVVLGYSLIFYCTFNLIRWIYGEALHLPKSKFLQILFLLISISGSVIMIGIVFIDFTVILIPTLIIILSLVVVGLYLPI